MTLLNEEITNQVKNELADLTGPVSIVMFTTQESECEYCAQTQELVEEIAATSNHVSVEVLNYETEKAKAEAYAVDKVPAIALVGEEDYGVRFYGIPSGYEFASLLNGIKVVASGKPTLEESTLEALAEIDEPLHIQVFVTPTCPYCQASVVLGHQMAIASPMVRADMVEATEFPDLAQRYQVFGVPRTVINETVHIEGAVAESVVVAKIREALDGA